MKHPEMNTYMSVTVWNYSDAPALNVAHIYTSVKSAKLDQHLWVDIQQGKKELARLMLRLGKMPSVTRLDGRTCYDLHGFLEE